MPLISFEGIDGSGKTTQVNNLVKYLQDRGEKVVRVREPGGTALGESLRDVLLHTSVNIAPESELLLFLSSRAQLVHETIRPALKSGAYVICDRFIDSSVAYQGYGRQIDPRRVFDLCIYATGGIVPDIVLLMDITPKDAVKREMIEKSFMGNPEKDRIEKESLEFYKRVYDGYMEWKSIAPYKVIAINAKEEPENVFSQIVEVLHTEDILPKKES